MSTDLKEMIGSLPGTSASHIKLLGDEALGHIPTLEDNLRLSEVPSSSGSPSAHSNWCKQASASASEGMSSENEK